MAQYVNAPIPIDPTELEEGAYNAIRAQFPDWEPSDGNLDVWLIKAFANIVAQIGETATDVSDTIFRYFGSEIASLPPLDATAATGQTNWTLINTLGHTIPAGTQIGFDNGDTLILFQTVSDTIVASGANTATSVEVVAVEPGVEGNGLTGPGQLIDQLDYVNTVALTAPTGGGADEETDENYLDRLVEELRLLTPRPILPADFATLAKRVPGVARATAINGYNPADGTYNNERTVTVAVIDEDGAPLDAPTKAAVDDLLTSYREVNFVVHIINPTYTTVNVAFTAVAWPGWDPALVKTQAETAITEYLSPANWGLAAEGGTAQWINKTVVRLFELAAVLDSVEGLDYVTALTINGGTANVTLTGVAPLPQPGTIVGTVT